MSKVVVMTSAVALMASASWAQDHRVEIGVGAGWTFSDGVTGGPILAGDGNLYDSIEPKDSFSWGLDLGFFVNENVQVGGLFSRQSSKMAIGGTNTVELGDWSVDNYHGIVTYNFGDSASQTRPYVFGGAGVTRYGSIGFTGANNQAREIGGESQFSTTWGAGVKIYPGEKVGLKLGARWTPTYIKSDAAGWWCDPYWGCYVVGDAQYSNQWELSGGLSFRFYGGAMRYTVAALAGVASLVAFALPAVAQQAPPNAPHYVKSVKAPGLDVRYLDFKWDEAAFNTLEKGGPHPVGRRSWVLARLLATANPFRCEGKTLPVGPSLLILNPARAGKGPTLELRKIDLREVFVDMNVVAEPPPGETYCQVPANFRKVDTTAGRLETTLTEGKGSIDVTVHYGDRDARITLVRY